jgi:hypothetical protein
MCCSSYICVYYIQSFNQFVLLLNLDQWYQSSHLFIYFSSCMSPTRSGYKKLGLEPIICSNIDCIEPDNNPWETKIKMMEQDILLKFCSRKPLSDKGTK